MMLRLAEAVAGWSGKLFRSLENPSVPLSAIDEDSDVWNALTGGSESVSGVRVNRRSALAYAPFWRGVNLLARGVGKLPLIVHERDGEGKNRATGHPAYPLLKFKPNAYTMAFQFKQTLTAHAITTGNGYAYIDRDEDGVPRELLQLQPDRTTPVRADGRLWYVIAIGGALDDENAELVRVPAEDVLHVKGLGFDGLVGYDVIRFHRDTLGKGIGTRRYGAVFFKNAATPHVVLEHPGELGDKAYARIQEGWQRMRANLQNAHRTALLEEGMKAHVISSNAAEAQLVESEQMDLVECANVLGLPVHKLGGEGRTSYNSLEQENQAYLDDGLDPWLIAWEEECWDKLLTERQKRRDSHVVAFERKALVRADLRTRAMFYRLALGGHPFMTMNEVRGLEDMNPAEGGDVIPKPLNMQSGPDSQSDGDGEQPAESNEPDSTTPNAEQKTALRTLLVETLTRVAKRLSVKACKRANRDAADLPTWSRSLVTDDREACLEILGTPVAVCRAAGLDVDAGELVNQLGEWLSRSLADCEGTPPGALHERVRQECDAFERHAPESLVPGDP